MYHGPNGAGGLSRSERNKRDKHERLKRAARALFGRKGFEGTTTREIAEAADIGAGTLFLYAGTKEDLLVRIFREEVGRVVEDAFATMTGARLIDQVLHVFGAIIAHHKRNFGLARVFVKELPFAEDRRHGIEAFMSDLMGRIAGLIERAQRRGELRTEVPPLLLAQNLFALYFSHLQKWLGGPALSPGQRDAGLRAALELQLGILCNGVALPARHVAHSNTSATRRRSPAWPAADANR